MADARLSVLLSAQDTASAVLRGVSNELGLLDQKAAGAKGFEKIGEGLAGVAKTAAGFALGGFALNIGGDIVKQFEEVLTGTVALGTGVRRLQLDIGGTAEQISGLLAVFNRFGVDGGQAEKTLTMFSRGLRGDETAVAGQVTNLKTFNGALDELGVASTDANGNLRPMHEVLLDVADGFKAHAADGQNAARAQTLFSRSGRELVPVLVLGREGIMELEAEAAKLGLTLSQDNVESVRTFVKSQKDMGEAIEGLKIQLGVALLPLFKDLAKAGTEWAKSLNEDGGKQIRSFANDVAGLVKTLADLKRGSDDLAATLNKSSQDSNNSAKRASEIITGNPGGFPGVVQDLKNRAAALGDVSDKTKKVIDLSKLDFNTNPGTPMAGMAADRGDRIAAADERIAAEEAAAQAQRDQVTLAKQKSDLDKVIAAGERESALIQHEIALKTRESLDMKRTEAELQLQLLPLKAQQAEIEQQLTLMTDKRTALMRDAAVLQAQMSADASADALEGVDFEERRLKAKIKADAVGGRGVAAGDIAALTGLALTKPQLELNALLGGRGATLAERDRQRAQQAQDLATIPLKMRAADVERDMASLSAQSAAVQRQIEEARLNGTIDTTDLQKQKQALDDALFTKNQAKADLEGKSIVLNINQQISANGEIDYDKIIQTTYQGVLDGLGTAQRTAGPPAPPGLPGSRGAGTGPF